MDRSKQILNAAKICMRKEGFKNTSIKNIAQCANVSTGLIYRYYKNKDCLIEALVINITDKMIHQFENCVREYDSTPDADQMENLTSVLPNVQSDIFMLMDIAAEAFRYNRYRDIISTAHNRLRQKIVNHEKKINPDENETTLHTRFYFLSILMDGVIVQRSRKGHAIDNQLNDLIDNIVRCTKRIQ